MRTSSALMMSMTAGLTQRVKKRLKQARHDVRNAYVRRFLAFTSDDLLRVLCSLGIRRGEVLCAHSSYDRFLGFQGHVGDAVNVLMQAVGPEGGLMMPTQPFGGSAISYIRKHPVTNIARAPSVVGMMTEVLRRTKGAVRTIHPTHPVALWGARGIQLAGNDWEARTPCGRHTAYYRLLESDGLIVMLGTTFQPLTFYHCVEELIEPALPFSPFTTEEFTLRSQDAQGNLYESHTRLFDPQLTARRRMAPMIPELKSRGLWKEARIGQMQVIVVRAADVLTACQAMAGKGQFCYVAHE